MPFKQLSSLTDETLKVERLRKLRQDGVKHFRLVGFDFEKLTLS